MLKVMSYMGRELSAALLSITQDRGKKSTVKYELHLTCHLWAIYSGSSLACQLLRESSKLSWIFSPPFAIILQTSV